MTVEFALRTGVVISVIMATKHLGIWDSSDDAQAVYHTTIKRVGPYAKQTCQHLNIDIPPLPPQREKSFLGVYYYNQAILTLGGFLTMCPIYMHDVLEKIPGILSKFSLRLREEYDKYQNQQAEKKQRKIYIDKKILVVPPQPHSDESCACKREIT